MSQNMSLNDVSLDLGGKKDSRHAHHSLKGQIHHGHKAEGSSLPIQCLNAPALDTRRKAVKSATLSREAIQGRAQTKSLVGQVR